MADSGRWIPNEGEPSLHEIHRTEQFLDALSSGDPVYAQDSGEDELAYLMAGWRDSARKTPMRSAITEQDAVAALQRGLAGSRSSRSPRGGAPKPGRRISLTVVGSAAAAVLCLGGFGAIVAGAGPGDPLYGLRSMLFGETVRDDPVVLAARTELAEVEELIEQGDWDAAQQRLQAVTTTVATVGDEQRKQELVAEWQQLSVKVESRNPDATVPPDAPPVTLPVIDPATTSPTDPTEPTESGDEPTELGEPGDEPTEPGEPGDEPTEPGEPGDEPTEPGEPGDGPTEPGEPGDEPTDVTTSPTEPDPAEPSPTDTTTAMSPSPTTAVTTAPNPTAPTTEVAPTEVPTTAVAPTEVAPTEVAPTEMPPTEMPTREVPPTTAVTSAQREAAAGGSDAEPVPTTVLPATEIPTPEAPVRQAPATTTSIMPIPGGGRGDEGSGEAGGSG